MFCGGVIIVSCSHHCVWVLRQMIGGQRLFLVFPVGPAFFLDGKAGILSACVSFCVLPIPPYRGVIWIVLRPVLGSSSPCLWQAWSCDAVWPNEHKGTCAKRLQGKVSLLFRRYTSKRWFCCFHWFLLSPHESSCNSSHLTSVGSDSLGTSWHTGGGRGEIGKEPWNLTLLPQPWLGAS